MLNAGVPAAERASSSYERGVDRQDWK